MASQVSTIQSISQSDHFNQKQTGIISSNELSPIQNKIVKRESNTNSMSNITIIENLAPFTDISPVMTIIDSELACFHIVRYTLRSHKRLTSEDIQYASNYISSFYSHSYDLLQGNFDVFSESRGLGIYDSQLFQQDGTKSVCSMINKRSHLKSTNILNDERLINFLTYADQKGLGKFALTFNEELDIAIISKDTVSMKKLLLGPKEMFIELYDNPYLATEDREFIIRLISRELFACTMAFELLKKKIINLETISDTCTSETLTFQAIRDGNMVNMEVLTTKCYDEVCIQDAKILEDDNVRAIMSQFEKISQSVFTVDKPTSSLTPQIYCFDTLDLMDAITNDTPINPQSGEPFSDFTLKLISQRFNKELSMYRRYKEIKMGENIGRNIY